jgi:hypothetical protein
LLCGLELILGICNHLLNGTPLSNKKTIKKTESVKRRASEGMSTIMWMNVPEVDTLKDPRKRIHQRINVRNYLMISLRSHLFHLSRI